MMKQFLCECGEDIIFSETKTFVHPDTKSGACKKCGTQYSLIAGKIVKKEKK